MMPGNNICIIANRTDENTLETKSTPILVMTHKNPRDILDAIREACLDYVANTEPGRHDYERNGNHWNIIDFWTTVPNEICTEHGFTKMNEMDDTICVNADQELVTKEEIAAAKNKSTKSNRVNTADGILAELRRSLTGEPDHIPTDRDAILFAATCSLSDTRPESGEMENMLKGLYMWMRGCSEKEGSTLTTGYSTFCFMLKKYIG